MPNCLIPSNLLRRRFWTYDSSTLQCFNVHIPIKHLDGAAFLGTDNYLKTLVLNILFTEAEHLPAVCGLTPGNRGGHWSTTFTEVDVGTNLNLETFKLSSKQYVTAITNIMQNSLQKLIDYKVANSVDVSSIITHCNKITMQINIIGIKNDEHRILLTNNDVTKNMWVWD